MLTELIELRAVVCIDCSGSIEPPVCVCVCVCVCACVCVCMCTCMYACVKRTHIHVHVRVNKEWAGSITAITIHCSHPEPVTTAACISAGTFM